MKTGKPAAAPAIGGGVRVERYKGGRHWAVLDGGVLVAVTLYRKGCAA